MATTTDLDYCETCNSVVVEGSEHNFQAHGSSKTSADELAAWKASFNK